MSLDRVTVHPAHLVYKMVILIPCRLRLCRLNALSFDCCKVNGNSLLLVGRAVFYVIGYLRLPRIGSVSHNVGGRTPRPPRFGACLSSSVVRSTRSSPNCRGYRRPWNSMHRRIQCGYASVRKPSCRIRGTATIRPHSGGADLSGNKPNGSRRFVDGGGHDAHLTTNLAE